MKILILCHSCLGDLILGFKNLHDIKKLLPDAEIHWAADKYYYEFLLNNPYINKIYGINRDVENHPCFDINYFDLIYDAHNNKWSKKFLSKFKGKVIRKSRYRIYKFLMVYNKFKFLQKPMVGVESYQKPLSKYFNVDLNKMNYQPNLNFNSNDKDLIQHLKLPNAYVCLISGASLPLKKWPQSYWINLIDKLINELKISVVAIGGPNDKIVGYNNSNFYDLSGQLTLSQSSIVLSQAKVFIGGDTGMTHLADYLKIPSICLRGASAFNFPKNSSTTTFYKNLKCQPCSKNGRGKCKNTQKQLACLYNITVDEVFKSIKSKIS